MASPKSSTASSPLSSAPDHLKPPSSSPHVAAAVATTPDANQSPGPVEGDSQFSGKEDQNEEVSAEIGTTNTQTASTREDDVYAPGGNGGGFAQSDIDAAIAASLTKGTSSIPTKRAHDSEEDAKEGSIKGKARKAATGAAKAAASRRKAMLTTNSKSPLVNINLTKLLRLPAAWRSLTYAQQKELASMLPDQPDIGGTGPHDSDNVMLNALMSNDALRTDVREWHEGLQNGIEELEWKEEAGEAMERRARGEFGSGKWVEIDCEKPNGTEEGSDGVVEAWWRATSLKP